MYYYFFWFNKIFIYILINIGYVVYEWNFFKFGIKNLYLYVWDSEILLNLN